MSDQERYQHFMSLALAEAQKAEALGEVPIGAIIVKGNQVVGAGYNRREVDANPLGHAELMAIAAAAKQLGGWRLQDCELYVTLEPCPMCAGAIVQSRIGKLIYGASDPKAGYAGSLYNVLKDQRLNHQTEIVTGIMQEACQTLLKHFFKELRERKKQAAAIKAEEPASEA